MHWKGKRLPTKLKLRNPARTSLNSKLTGNQEKGERNGFIWLHFSAAVESTGQAKAEAQSRAEAAKIEGEAAVEQARLKAQASKIEAVSISRVYWNIQECTDHRNLSSRG